MADCDDRQLTDDDRAEGARQQQRQGVQQAIRPFRGTLPPGMQPLMDWLNRQLVPVLQQTRKAVNDVWRTSVDNVPGTGNPLVHFFSESTGGGDPGTGRSALNQAVQNTATSLVFSDLNGQLADVSVFAEVMQGSVTEPLGILTLQHAANPARYIRFDLTAISDQTTHWEATVDPVESSHPVPFVEGDPVTIAFLPGVGSDGAVVPASSFELVSQDTFMSNLTNGAAPPFPNSLSLFVGDGLDYDAVGKQMLVDVTDLVDNVSITEVATNNIQRAALTGAIAASAGANATLFSGIRDNGSAESDRSNLNFVAGTNTTVAITDDAGNDELEIQVNVDDLPISALADIAAGTFLANVTAGAAPPTAHSLTTFAGAGLTYANVTGILAVGGSTSIIANADDLNRAALTGAIAAPQNSNATLFSGIRDNGAAENDRSNLNFVAGTNTTATVTDDAGNDELEVRFNVDDFPLTGLADQAAGTFLANITAGAAPPTAHSLATFAGAGLTYTNVTGILAVGSSTSIAVNADDVQRAALTGAIAASANSNATVFSGIRDNGVAENDRSNLNFLSGAGVNVAITDDAGNDELEIAFSVDLTDFDSTSIVVNGTVLERAALTGAIAASQNSNATVFAGIRDNGSAESDRSNLNFVNSTSMTAVVTDDAGNDELEVTYQRAALTGEVTASANSNTTTIDKAISPTWTGSHTFSTAVIVSGSFQASGNSEIQAVQFTEEVRLNNVISPTIAADQNNWTPTGWATSNVVRVQASGADRTITGAAAGASGEVKMLINVGSNAVVLPQESASSTAANRFLVAHTSCTLHQNDIAWIFYDPTSSRWRVMKPGATS